MQSLKIRLTLIILLFINFVFALKYLSRYTELAIYIAVILIIFQLFLYWSGNRIKRSAEFKNITGYSTIGLVVVLIILSHFAIPVESLNVDRWSVISSFINEALNGNYPYYARSHMGNLPGPMPVYFLIALPFHLIGELSILSGLGYVVIVLLLIRKTGMTQNLKFSLFYLLTSVYLAWEITTRSNLFTFSIFIILILNGFINLKDKSSLYFYLLAILTGLFLSTRSIYLLPYIVFFLSSLINRDITPGKLFLFLSIAVISFLITFVPFVFFFGNDFFTMNPFIIQSSFLIPGYYTVIFILISIFLSFLVKNNADKYFFSGVSLFITVLIYSVYHLVISGYDVAFTRSKIDISYFIFSVPFLIMYLSESDR